MPELCIGGHWRSASDDATREIRCPADAGKVVAVVSEGTADDAAAAVGAARRQGYNVTGYTQTQLIDDVLDQYERPLEFLRLSERPSL